MEVRPRLVQKPSYSTAQPVVSGSQQSSDGGIHLTSLTMQERPQLHILGKMNLHLLQSAVHLKHQGWDIWAAASHPNTQLTTPGWQSPTLLPEVFWESRGRGWVSKHCPAFCEGHPSMTPLP